jgi:hypothetical protein
MATMAQRLAALEAEVSKLRELVAMRETLLAVVHDTGYDAGRASILGRQAAASPPRPRHLRVAEEAAR